MQWLQSIVIGRMNELNFDGRNYDNQNIRFEWNITNRESRSAHDLVYGLLITNLTKKWEELYFLGQRPHLHTKVLITAWRNTITFHMDQLTIEMKPLSLSRLNSICVHFYVNDWDETIITCLKTPSETIIVQKTVRQVIGIAEELWSTSVFVGLRHISYQLEVLHMRE